MRKFWTPLAPDQLFDGTQMDLVSPGTSIENVRFLLENEDETLVAYGNEVSTVEVEDDEDE